MINCLMIEIINLKMIIHFNLAINLILFNPAILSLRYFIILLLGFIIFIMGFIISFIISFIINFIISFLYQIHLLQFMSII